MSLGLAKLQAHLAQCHLYKRDQDWMTLWKNRDPILHLPVHISSCYAATEVTEAALEEKNPAGKTLTF